jgi:hypothetical protein
MWKASAGHRVEVEDNGGDDDWETDPDFVVRDECCCLRRPPLCALAWRTPSALIIFRTMCRRRHSAGAPSLSRARAAWAP